MKLKKQLDLRNKQSLNKFNTEDEYYKYLFTQSGYYSTRELNSEELVRWENINKLISQALLLKGKNSFERVIDYGCGRGWLTNQLKSYGQVTGIEPVRAVVEFGRELFPGLDLRNGKLDILKEIEADLIVSSEVIEHINRDEQLNYFIEFKTALSSKNGFLIITTPRQECFSEWSKFLDPSQPIEDWLMEDEVKMYAERAGFSVISKLTYSSKPAENAESLEVYQQWLFRA